MVVGAGPAGSVAAKALAEGGAAVALVDKARFPRDKACGDVVGPRAVSLLKKLYDRLPPEMAHVGDMDVLGPGRGRVRLPARPGAHFPAGGWSVPRLVMDHFLFEEAISAGAVPFHGRLGGIRTSGGRQVAELDRNRSLAADFLVGADGATSSVASCAGMVDSERVLWGFATRCYVEEVVPVPLISFWDERPWRSFPGYGWLFPGPDGRANAGLGTGTGHTREGASRAVRRLDRFLDHLRSRGHLGAAGAEQRMGGWLKMGMVGTRAARGRILLAGDAAGLVNPLQGEGIAQAVGSAIAAARAILDHEGNAAAHYTRWMQTEAAFQGSTAALHEALLPHPRAVSALAHLLTSGPLGGRIGEPWGLYWNDLTEGAHPGPARTMAAAVGAGVRGLTSASTARRALSRELRWA